MALKKHKSNKKFSFRGTSRGLLLLANLIVLAVYLLACIQPKLSPETFWFIGYLSIAFPYILLIIVCFAIFWLFSKSHKRFVFFSLVTIALSYKQIGVLFSLQANEFAISKESNHLRVMTWNLMSFYGFKPGIKEREKNADKIFNLIKKYKPDILCFQEYGQFEDPKLGRSYQKQMETLGYKHHVLSRDYSRVALSYSNGLAIFSKYPIVYKKRIPYLSSAESLLFADIKVGADTFRVFTTHLQSYKFTAEELKEIDRIKENEKPRWMQSRSLLSKMQRAFRNRGAQVDQALPFINSSNYPVIIGIDMNDVPNSYAYWKIRDSKKDAFLEKGFGIGRTYSSILPTLRIDYIIADQQFTIQQVENPAQNYSDHLPVIADLYLAK